MSKVAIFSDLHLGIKQDSPIWHNIGLEWCDWFISKLRANQITEIIFLGDFFHTRNTISANTLYIASKILDKLKEFKLHLIFGNHDLYFANNPTISPVNLFQGRNNIKVYSEPELVKFGNTDVLFSGWGYDATKYKADVLFTHAEINGFRYNLDIVNCDSEIKASSLLSNFKLVYSGHFHLRQQKSWLDKRIIYVGNTFPMDHSDSYITEKGFDILDLDTLTSTFIENTVSPKFYKLKLSEIIDDKWSYKQLNQMISKNVVKLIIDLDITYSDVNILSNIINNLSPLDFSLEWENNKILPQNHPDEIIEAFNMEDTIRKYIELLEIPNKSEIIDYMLQLYQKAQD